MSDDCVVLYTNIDSFLNKRGQFLDIVNDVKPKIIALTEVIAKNQKDLNQTEYQITGYTMFINKNPKLGTAIYTQNDLNAVECDVLNCLPYQESVWCTFSSKEEKFLIGCVYKSPNSIKENTDNLYMLLSHPEIKRYDKVCIVGDFNYPTIKWNGEWSNEDDNEFIECIREAYLTQMVRNPTRVRKGFKPSLLDLVLVNDEQMISDIEHSCPCAKSDHEILTFSLYLNDNNTENDTGYVYNLGKGNYTQMRRDLENIDWTKMHDLNVNDGWIYIKDKIQQSMQQNIPKSKTRNSKDTKSKPIWFSNKLKKSVKKKYNLYRKYQETNSKSSFDRYIEIRNKCEKDVRDAKRDYEKRLARECKTNPKHFWKYVQKQTKSIDGISPLKTGDGSLATTDKEKAKILNDFFSGVFTRENPDSVPEVAKGEKSGCVFLSEILVTPKSIEDKLKGLNPNKAQGPDKLPPRVFKELAQVLSQPLSILYNKSLETGIVPSDWKCAEVTAVFKKGTRSDPGNYRPVSLTCIACKVLESIIRDVIVDHMTTNKLFSECQHGFRKHRSCCTQLLEVMEDLNRLMEEKDSIDIIYLDFKKAFDTVPHARLLAKMEGYGVTGSILQWIRDYLNKRSQKVRVGTDYSELTDVLSGIPQGSILGPILFIIFINDLPDEMTCYCKIFADDTKIYERAKNSASLQDNLDRLQTWSEKWKLFFNISKCKVLHVGKQNPKHDYKMLKDDGTYDTVNKCKNEKDIGVVFDELLSFDTHIQETINKANKRIGIIRRTFTHIDRDIFNLVYKVLIRPILEYGNIIWHPNLKRQSIAIERVQRRATKLVPELKSDDYATRLEKLNLPSLKYRRFRGDMIQTYKILTEIDDIDASKFFSRKKVDKTRNFDTDLYVQYSATNRKKMGFSTRAVKGWNALSRYTKLASNLNQFKSLLDNDPNLSIKQYDFD